MKNIFQSKYSPVKYLQKSKFNGVNKIIIIFILLGLTGVIYFQTQATNFSWMQSGWLGGQSASTATHSTDANNTWTNYADKDVSMNTNGSGDAQLKKADSVTETTDADFNTNTSKDSSLAVSGNSIKLLKADGATCSIAGDCQSNTCTGNLCVTPFGCGTSTVSYGGKNYATVQIGTQCWFRENLNVGIRMAGTAMPDNTAPTLNNPATVSKWCYSNAEANCTTDGGLYSWAEANALANSCNTTTCTPSIPNQGICPTGWHIPSHDEYTTLERAVCTSGTCATDFPYNMSTVDWRGTNEGTKLKTVSSSTFSGLLAGYRNPSGAFGGRSTYGTVWNASPDSASSAWARDLASGYTAIYRYPGVKSYGFSVRCIKN